MHKEFHDEALRRLRALVERETGVALGSTAQAEMDAILRGSDGPGCATNDGTCIALRPMTVLQAELRGFNALSAAQPAAVVAGALDRCLGRLSEVVSRYQGSAHRFIGDSITVLFGAPVARDDDVRRALMCAVEMQMAMRDLNLAHTREGLPHLFLGIGAHTGAVLAGRFGPDASEYTVNGDVVNLAPGIAAASLRGQVLISEASYELAWGLVSASSPMPVHVKGREAPLVLRELVAIPSQKLKVPRQEFRRSHRVDARLPCVCRRVEDKAAAPHVVNAAIRDIGYHGLLLELDEPLALQGEVALEFNLPLVDYRATEVYARVITSKQEGAHWLAGLEFISLSAECSAKLQMFVQRLVGSR